jgi:hypothetical protein
MSTGAEAALAPPAVWARTRTRQAPSGARGTTSDGVWLVMTGMKSAPPAAAASTMYEKGAGPDGDGAQCSDTWSSMTAAETFTGASGASVTPRLNRARFDAGLRPALFSAINSTSYEPLDSGGDVQARSPTSTVATSDKAVPARAPRTTQEVTPPPTEGDHLKVTRLPVKLIASSGAPGTALGC